MSEQPNQPEMREIYALFCAKKTFGFGFGEEHRPSVLLSTPALRSCLKKGRKRKILYLGKCQLPVRYLVSPVDGDFVRL